MIENIKTFLKEPKKSKIYSILNVKEREILILKKMLQEYIEGYEDIKVRGLLNELFNDNLEALENIDAIKNLLDEGWIVISDFSEIKNVDISMLELFNSRVSLSVAFLKLIEQGSIDDVVILEKTPYNDHLEYLHDQFIRIEIYEQLSLIKSNLSKESSSIKRLQSKLKLIENTIKEKIKKNKNRPSRSKFYKRVWT
jgi:hypothetical protein